MYDNLADERPVVFIIEVLCDSEPCETSIRVALACRNVIRSMGITDVEVEIQQIIETQFAVNKEVDIFTENIRTAIIEKKNRRFRGTLGDIHDNIYRFSSHIGCEINNPKFKKAGSLGLHLKLGDESPLYGLTCRHVVFEDINLPSADFNIDVSGDKSALIQQLSQSTAAGLANKAAASERACRKLHQALTSKITEWDELYSTTEETVEAKKFRCPTREERERLPMLSYLLSQTTRAASLTLSVSNQSRMIGHVAYSPSFAKSPQGHLQDWVLIELDAVNGFAAYPTNKVYIGHEAAERRDIGYCKTDGGKLYDVDGKRPHLLDHLDDDGFLQIRGVVPTPTDGKAAELPVGMYGMTSRLSFGLTNEILAVRRNDMKGGMIVWEWIVFSEERKAAFSAQGDSGAAVWDHTGRFVGMMTAGAAVDETRFMHSEPYTRNTSLPEENDAGSTAADVPPLLASFDARQDMTFVIPAEQLFKNIQEFTGRIPHIA